MSRRDVLREVAAWLAVIGLALLFSFLVTPGADKLLPKRAESAPLDCVEWHTIESFREPTGERLGGVRYCAGYE
jgi:hypothetical protein